jgi:hypothetical protein
VGIQVVCQVAILAAYIQTSPRNWLRVHHYEPGQALSEQLCAEDPFVL